MALKLASGAHFGYNRYCKANPVDLEGSRGQVLEVLGGFWWVLGGGRSGRAASNHVLKIPCIKKPCIKNPRPGPARVSPDVATTAAAHI